jgi:hypothetical protein
MILQPLCNQDIARLIHRLAPGSSGGFFVGGGQSLSRGLVDLRCSTDLRAHTVGLSGILEVSGFPAGRSGNLVMSVVPTSWGIRMAQASEAGAGGWTFRRWLERPLRIGINHEVLTWVAVGIGLALRLLAYADNRALYRDEESLLVNLVKLPVFDFHTTLTEYQLAPPAFLALERIMVRLPANNVMAARFFPLVCGLASLFLFRSTARRFLLPHAVPIAVGLFALSDWLIYYSSEIKQYSCDLALTLVTLLLAAGPAPRTASGSQKGLDGPGSAPLSVRRLLYLGAFGAIGVWFSYPLVFVLAAAGTYLLAVAVIRRDHRGILGLGAIGLAWVASFIVCYVISHGMLDKGRFIWDWWAFSFLPLPPRSMADLRYDFWHIVNVFDSPADVKMPLNPIVTAMLALALAIAGSASMLRRWPGGLYLLTAPVAFALVASALQQYPFHGRLLIFLVPSVHMLVSQGAVAVSRPGGPRLAIVLGAFLLFQPALDALGHRTTQPLNHAGFDSHGDLRPDLLDYLDYIEARRSKR